MISREDVGRVAVIRMAHGKVSALDVEFCGVLVEEIQAVANACSALVLTGTGSSFSAGVDLRVLNAEALEQLLDRFLPAMESLFLTLLTFPNRPWQPSTVMRSLEAASWRPATTAASSDGDGRIGVPELAVGLLALTLPFEIVGARLQSVVFSAIGLYRAGRTAKGGLRARVDR